MTTIASLYRIGGCWQQLVVKKRQRLFQMRREYLLSRVPNPREPPHPLTQLLQLAKRRLRPTAPVKQRVNVIHDLAQLAQMRQTSGDLHEPLAFARFQTTFDKQGAILEQVTDFLLDIFTFAGQAARFFLF